MNDRLLLGPADHGRPLTWDEFRSARGEEGYQYELIGGKVEVSPLPDLPHECLRDWIREKLEAYCKQHPDVINRVLAPARVFIPETPPTTAPEPDVAAYPDFPFDVPLKERSWKTIHPLLVVEVLSADTADKDLIRNRDLYLRAQTIQEYWILDPRTNPDQPTLTVYRRRGNRWQKPIQVAAGDAYTSPRNFPGLSLVVDPHADQ